MAQPALNIGKTIKAVVVSSATAAFLLSGLMLCCQVRLAHQLKEKASSCCAASKTAQIKIKDTLSCICCQLTKNTPDQIQGSIKIAQIGKSVHKIFLIVQSIADIQRLGQSYALAYQGPPRANVSTPIYLQISNLRL